MAGEDQPDRKHSLQLMLEQLVGRDLLLLYQDNTLSLAKATKSGLPAPVGFDRLGLPRPAKDEGLAKDFYRFPEKITFEGYEPIEGIANVQGIPWLIFGRGQEGSDASDRNFPHVLKYGQSEKRRSVDR